MAVKNWLKYEPRITAKDDFEVIKGKAGRPKGSKNDPDSKANKLARKKIGDDESLRQLVSMMTACGVSKVKMAKILRITPVTLARNFEYELDNGEISANMKVAQSLFNKAIEGDVRAQMFWLKSKGGFIEKNEVDINTNGADLMSATEKGQRLAAIMLSDPALLAKFKKPKTEDLPPEDRPPIDVN